MSALNSVVLKLLRHKSLSLPFNSGQQGLKYKYNWPHRNEPVAKSKATVQSSVCSMHWNSPQWMVFTKFL